MKCDELKAEQWLDYGGEPRSCYPKADVDEAIAEMKEENATLRGANEEKTERIVELQKLVDKLDGVKKSAELILMNLLDCGLIKEWYFNGKFNAVLNADDPHLKIAELKQKLEDVNELIKTARKMLEDAKATAYTESVDAGMRDRRLKRALWIARAERASDKARIFYFAETCGVKLNIDGYSNKEKGHTRMCTARWWRITWLKVERKCRAKAEEYK